MKFSLILQGDGTHLGITTFVFSQVFLALAKPCYSQYLASVFPHL